MVVIVNVVIPVGVIHAFIAGRLSCALRWWDGTGKGVCNLEKTEVLLGFVFLDQTVFNGSPAGMALSRPHVW